MYVDKYYENDYTKIRFNVKSNYKNSVASKDTTSPVATVVKLALSYIN